MVPQYAGTLRVEGTMNSSVPCLFLLVSLVCLGSLVPNAQPMGQPNLKKLIDTFML
jgi:hypothetical protein